MNKQLMTAIVAMAMGLPVAGQTADQQSVQKDSVQQTLRIGYAKASENTVTGAVEQVTEGQMKKGMMTSSLEALNGMAAGVQVERGGNQEAMMSAVRVRGNTSLTGSNDPLVIIDGVICDLSTLSTIYPADIESFTILKDAAETAQYGSRGSAGVIEVSTKKGVGKKFYLSYDGNIGFESVYKRVNMLNAQQFREANAALGRQYADMGYDTDFGRSIERTGFINNHHIAFGGGTDKSNYRASVGIMDHKTVIRTNEYRNYSAKLDIMQHAFDNRMKLELGLFGSVQKNNHLANKQQLLYSAQAYNPTFPDGALPDGTYPSLPESFFLVHPEAMLQMKKDEDNGHFNARIKATVDLGYDMKLRGFASYSYKTIDNSNYYPTYVQHGGEAKRAHDKSTELRGNLSLEKTFKFKTSDLNLMLLAEASKQENTGFYTTVTEFTSDAFGYDKLTAGATRPWEGTDSYYTDAHMESFLFRGRYTLLGRYTVTANARADASSKFGKNNRWGFFPSISGAWVFSKEPWMKNFTFLSNGKLRIGYGLSGSFRGVGAYNSMELMQPNGLVPMDGTVVTTLGIIRNSNPDLKWEQKRTFNIGLDLSFWHKRIALTMDYYTSKTTDMLYVYTVPVPPFLYDKLLANMGSMESSGLEIGFGITPLRTKDMELSVNMNWSFPRNKLLSLDGYYNGQYLTAPQTKGISYLYGAGFNSTSSIVIQKVGEPLGVFNLPHCEGLEVAADGTRHYKVSSSKSICGQATPKAMMGSNIAFRYRQWDVTMQINGAFGHKIFNGTKLTYMNMQSLPNYNVIEGAPELNIQDQTISDYWLESGDYVNIDYVTVGWTVPMRSRYVKNLRVSLSVDNLATITGYSGVTPMINSSVMNGTLGLDDKNTLPAYRSYAVGVSLQF